MSEIQSFPDCDESAAVIHSISEPCAGREIGEYEFIESLDDSAVSGDFRGEDSFGDVEEAEDDLAGLRIVEDDKTCLQEVQVDEDEDDGVGSAEVEEEGVVQDGAFSVGLIGDFSADMEVTGDGCPTFPEAAELESPSNATQFQAPRRRSSLHWKKFAGENFKMTRACFAVIRSWVSSVNRRGFDADGSVKRRRLGSVEHEHASRRPVSPSDLVVVVSGIRAVNRVFVMECGCGQEPVVAVVLKPLAPVNVAPGMKLALKQYTIVGEVARDSPKGRKPSNATVILVTRMSVVEKDESDDFVVPSSQEEEKFVIYNLRRKKKTSAPIRWIDTSVDHLPVPRVTDSVAEVRGRLRKYWRFRNHGIGSLSSADVSVVVVNSENDSSDIRLWIQDASELFKSSVVNCDMVEWNNTLDLHVDGVGGIGLTKNRALGSASAAAFSYLTESSFSSGSPSIAESAEDSLAQQKRKHVVGTVVLERFDFLLLQCRSQSAGAAWLRVSIDGVDLVPRTSRDGLVGKRVQLRRLLEISDGEYVADELSEVRLCSGPGRRCSVRSDLKCFSPGNGWLRGKVGVVSGSIVCVHGFSGRRGDDCADRPTLKRLVIQNPEHPSNDSVIVEVSRSVADLAGLPFLSQELVEGAQVGLPVFVADVDPSPWWGKRIVRCLAVAAAVEER